MSFYITPTPPHSGLTALLGGEGQLYYHLGPLQYGFLQSLYSGGSAVSATTFYSGNTELGSLIPPATYVQDGVNTTTGGTASRPTVNVVASPSFTSVSATTLFSGNTNLQDLFLTPTPQNRVLYVSKTGSNTNGATPNAAFNTISEACSYYRSNFGDATATRYYEIKILDSENYAESIVVPHYVYVSGPGANLYGNATIGDGSMLWVNNHYAGSSGNASGIVNKSGVTDTSYYKAKILDTRGSGNTYFNNSGVMSTGATGQMFVDIKKLYVSGGGVGIGNMGGSDNGHIHLNVEDLYLAGNNATGIRTEDLDGNQNISIVGYVHHILEAGSQTGTVAFQMYNGRISIVSTEILVDMFAYVARGDGANSALSVVCPNIVVGTTYSQDLGQGDQIGALKKNIVSNTFQTSFYSGVTANALTATTFNIGATSVGTNSIFLNRETNGQVRSRDISNFSFTSVSATTFFSGSTNLNDLISGTATYVQDGVNTTTGGTASRPTVNVVASPSFTSVSATTFYGDGGQLTGIPFVTGGTYSNGTATFANSTGGTFDVNGFYTGSSATDVYTTGGTYSSGTATFANSTGGTFDVSGLLTTNDFYIAVTTGDTFDSTIRADQSNSAIDGCTVFGSINTAAAQGATIGGGFLNYADGIQSVVAGGVGNNSFGDYSFVGGGASNSVNGDASSIVGGNFNSTIAHNSFIGGGQYNTVDVDGLGSVILGGSGNTAYSANMFILGRDITANSADTTFVNYLNLHNALEQDDTLTQVLVRSSNGRVKYRSATTFSGDAVSLIISTGSTSNSTMRVGLGNTASDNCTVFGTSNSASSSGGTIGGGSGNAIASGADFSNIIGGMDNVIKSNTILSSILGGSGNTISHSNSFIIGNDITTSNSNTIYTCRQEYWSYVTPTYNAQTEYVGATLSGTDNGGIIEFTASGATLAKGTMIFRVIWTQTFTHDSAIVLQPCNEDSAAAMVYVISDKNGFKLYNAVAIKIGSVYKWNYVNNPF